MSNHATDLLPFHLISCKMFLQLFLFSNYFPAFFLLLLLLQFQFKITLFFLKMLHFLRLNILCFLCSIWHMGLWALQIIAFCFYLHFMQRPNFWGNWEIVGRLWLRSMHQNQNVFCPKLWKHENLCFLTY